MTKTPPDPRDTNLVRLFLCALIRSGDTTIITRAHELFGEGRLCAIPQLREILDELAAIAAEVLPLGEGEILFLATRLATRYAHRGDAESWMKILKDLLALRSDASWLPWLEGVLLQAVIQIETRRLGEKAEGGLGGKDLLRELHSLSARARSLDQGGASGSADPSLVCMADVEPEPVEWLWNPYFAIGKLVLLEGDPGLGKSWFALSLCAIVSRGWSFPDVDGVPREVREPANVIYLSAEDGLADTLRPRLDAAEADVKRIHILTGKKVLDRATGEMKVIGVTLADLAVLEAALREVKPAFLVVDPLQAFMGANVDIHRANETRTILAGLALLAEKYRCAVLCIRHLNKDEKRKALYRGLGSIDFSAAARSILLLGQDPECPARRAVAHIKSNLAQTGPTQGFELVDGQLLWTGTNDLTPDALLGGQVTDEERTALEEAVTFLLDFLADGPRPAAEGLKEAKRAGIAPKTLERARFQAGVRCRKLTEPGKPRGTGNWVWILGGHDSSPDPPSTPDGDLEDPSEAAPSKEVPDSVLDRHMTILNDKPNPLEKQEVTADVLDRHGEEEGPKDEGGGEDDPDFF